MKTDYVTCNACPFMIQGHAICDSVPGAPPVHMPSMLCLKRDNKVIVDPKTKPDFCPLPLKLRWGPEPTCWSDARIPNDLIHTNVGMSNLDHSIEAGFADMLKTGTHRGKYAADAFTGHLWWTGKRFACEVWRHGSWRITCEALTLEQIMETLCERYGPL